MQRSALCRSRRELSNEYLLAKFGLDTAKNEPCQVCPTAGAGSSALQEALAVEREGEKSGAATGCQSDVIDVWQTFETV